MLSILVNDQSLDLSEDFSVSLNLKSPIFSSVGDYSFPFRVPSTDRNRSILGWKNRITSTRDIYETFSGSLRWNGTTLFSGQVKVRSAGEKSFEGTLYMNKGNFNYEIKNQLLHRLDLGMMTFPDDQSAINYFNWSLGRFYPETDFALPEIPNTDFFDPPATNPELYNYNHIFPDGWLHKTTSDGKDRTILVPFLYLRYLLQRLAGLYGYRLEDHFFTSRDELSRQVIYHSVNLSQQFAGLQLIYYCRFVPQIKVSEFLSALEKWFNCSIHADHNRRVIRIVGNTDVLLNSPVNDFSTGILSISQDIPEPVSGYHFVVGEDSGDKVYQGQLETEKGITELMKGAVRTFVDIPPYPFTWLGDIYYTVDTGLWWQLSVNPITFLVEWVQLPSGPLLTDQFFYRYSDDPAKVETRFSTLLHKFLGVSCGNPGSGHQKVTPRLFWVGTTGGFGTPVRFRGLSSMASFSLQYPGTNGLFSTFWKEWVSWAMDKRKSVIIEKQIDFAGLKALDFTQKYRVHGTNYLISEVAVTLTRTTIKPARLKCFTAP